MANELGRQGGSDNKEQPRTKFTKGNRRKTEGRQAWETRWPRTKFTQGNRREYIREIERK